MVALSDLCVSLLFLDHWRCNPKTPSTDLPIPTNIYCPLLKKKRWITTVGRCEKSMYSIVGGGASTTTSYLHCKKSERKVNCAFWTPRILPILADSDTGPLEGCFLRCCTWCLFSFLSNNRIIPSSPLLLFPLFKFNSHDFYGPSNPQILPSTLST